MTTDTPILMYHSVSERAPRRFRRFSVTPRGFEQQLRHMRERGCTALTIGELMRLRAGRLENPPARPVVLTFDDGFADFHEHAMPALARYGMRATLYVTTGYVGRTSAWLQGIGAGHLPMLNWGQLAELAQHGIEIGAHTASHPALDALPRIEAAREIVVSKRTLEDKLGIAVDSFAYPFGYHSPGVRRAVREAGFGSACAVGYRTSRPDENPFALSRHIACEQTQTVALDALLGTRPTSMAVLRDRLRSAAWARLRHHVLGYNHA